MNQRIYLKRIISIQMLGFLGFRCAPERSFQVPQSDAIGFLKHEVFSQDTVEEEILKKFSVQLHSLVSAPITFLRQGHRFIWHQHERISKHLKTESQTDPCEDWRLHLLTQDWFFLVPGAMTWSILESPCCWKETQLLEGPHWDPQLNSYVILLPGCLTTIQHSSIRSPQIFKFNFYLKIQDPPLWIPIKIELYLHAQSTQWRHL